MISFVVAMDQNRGIGYKGRLPWHLPADLKFFKETTTGHTILMGRKTFESIGRPLPNRTNVVLTGNPDFRAEGVEIVRSPEEALKRFAADRDLYVIGGAEIFRQLLPFADKLIVTRIGHSFAADTFFPELAVEEWREVSCVPGVTDELNPYPYQFVELVRRS